MFDQHWIEVRPVIDYSTRTMCRRAYPGHPGGCPNYGRKKDCPPKVELFDEAFDLSQPVYAIYNVIDLAGHVAAMRMAHPDWPEHQLRQESYWRDEARANMIKYIRYFLKTHKGYDIVLTPEAMGVDITKTMATAGIVLEWPPDRIAYQIVLAGMRRNGDR